MTPKAGPWEIDTGEADFQVSIWLEYHLVALEVTLGQSLLLMLVRRIVYQTKALDMREPKKLVVIIFYKIVINSAK